MRTGALEVLTGYATAPSTSDTALTMASGNSLTIRNTPGRAYIVGAWGDFQADGIINIRSPRMHDNVRGIQFSVEAALVRNLIGNFAQPLLAQDTLTVTCQGSGTGGDIETVSLLVYYDALPGSNGIFITPDELQRFGKNQMGIPNTLASGTSGGYSGEEAINAEADLMKANTYYALIGHTNAVQAATIRVRSVDFGNLGVGMPGDTEASRTGNFFVELSQRFRLPLIPVVNSANKGATLIDCAQDENGADPIVATQWVELDKAFNPASLA